jgi:hypothetical protein
MTTCKLHEYCVLDAGHAGPCRGRDGGVGMSVAAFLVQRGSARARQYGGGPGAD